MLPLTYLSWSICSLLRVTLCTPPATHSLFSSSILFIKKVSSFWVFFAFASFCFRWNSLAAVLLSSPE